MNIYISNLSYNSTSESLSQLFTKFGEVTSAVVITDMMTGQSRGFGFANMPNDNEGSNAISKLNESEFEGKKINVSIARPKTERRGGFNRN